MVDNDFVDDTEILDFINAGYDILWAILVKMYEDFQLSSALVTLVSNQETYDVSAFNPVVAKLRGVDVNVDGPNGRYVPIQTFEWNDRGSMPPGPNSFSGSLIKVWYTPKNIPLVDDTDALPIYIHDTWAELIVLEAALRCAMKEEGMAGNIPIIKAEIQQARADIAGEAPIRDSSSPKVATRRADLRRGHDRYGPLPRLRPWGRAAALKYRFEGMQIRVLGGIWF